MTTLRWAAWFFYEAMTLVGWPFLYLYYLCRVWNDGKYGTNYRARMGLAIPSFPLKKGGNVWFHALSLGEALSAIPLLREFKDLCPGSTVCFSTATETGMSIARDRLSGLVDTFFYMPHDFPWAVHTLVSRMQPFLFVLIETDFWPNLIIELKKRNTFTVLVNGRMSPNSFRRYSRLGFWARTMFGGFGLIFTQTELDKFRFLSCGGHEVKAAGNLKLDFSSYTISEIDRDALRKELVLPPGRPVWIAGSTHEGEEEILLKVHRELCSIIPGLLLIIAPRDIKRLSELAVLCNSLGYRPGIRSRGEKAEGKAVFLLDTIGELALFYSVADVAFLGGSMVPFGGHNPLEAVVWGRPACWGPHFFNFSEIGALLRESGCGMCTGTPQELSCFIKSIFTDEKQRGAMTLAARQFVSLQQGVSRRIASDIIEKTANKNLTPETLHLECDRTS